MLSVCLRFSLFSVTKANANEKGNLPCYRAPTTDLAAVSRTQHGLSKPALPATLPAVPRTQLATSPLLETLLQDLSRPLKNDHSSVPDDPDAFREKTYTS